MKVSALLFALVAGTTNAIELTPENWDEAVAGKTVFIKFLAPWCGHCKSMKPAWDQLMDAFADSPTALVADVDCTAEGEPLCEAHGVQGFPTIKYGDPTALEDYEGGRDFNSMKTFAEENLKPMCSPTNIDLCDDEKKALIEKYQAMSSDELKAAVAEKEAAITKLNSDFESGVEGLQAQYEQLMAAKDEGVKDIKASGLGFMKAVIASSKAKGSDEL